MAMSNYKNDVVDHSKLYERVVHSIPHALISTDNSGTIIFWSPAAERIYGCSPADAVGNDVLELIGWGEHAEEVRAALTEGGSWSGRHTGSSNEGPEIAVHTSLCPLRDNSGNRKGMVIVSHEVPGREDNGARTASSTSCRPGCSGRNRRGKYVFWFVEPCIG